MKMPRHGPAIEETRITEWVNVEDSPAWDGSPVAAYRIRVMFDSLCWWQSHEWKYRDGTTMVEDWIRGLSRFPTHSRTIQSAKLDNATEEQMR